MNFKVVSGVFFHYERKRETERERSINKTKIMEKLYSYEGK